MGFVSKINRTSVLLLAFAIISGGSAVQVSAATEKPVTKPSLLSVCVNPAKTQTRAAQDDRCTDKNTGTIYESLPSKIAKSSSPKKDSLPAKTAGSSIQNNQSLPAKTANSSTQSNQSLPAVTATTVPAGASGADTPGATATASATSTSVASPASSAKSTVPVKPKNKNVTSAVNTTVPVIPAATASSNVASGSNVAVVSPVEVVGLISVCVNKSTSVLRDTADNSCSSGSEVKVEWLDSGASPKICVNNNNRQMTLAQDGKCATKNSAVADVTVNKQILACADDKTGVLRYQKSGVCGVNNDPVVWVLKDQGVARNVDDAVKTAGIQIISLIPTGGAGGAGGAGTSSGANTGGSTKTVTTSPTTNTSTATTTAVATAITTTTTSSTTTSTTTTIASRASGSFAGYLGGTCPDGSGIPWYWGSGGQARAGGCSAAASIAPISTGSSESAATTTTTVAPVVVPGTPATPTGVSGNTQVTVSVTAGTGGTPTSYTVSASPQVSGVTRTCTVTGASGSCVVTGLTNGTPYTFTTTATNSAGTSGLSTASSSVTPATVPGAPTIGTATVASATSVTVACTAPASNGGATITTYTATSSPGSRTGTLTSATCSSAITVTGLTAGTAYTFTVTATNSAGTSAASAASNSVTPSATCATGGTCILGDTGPLGGKVYYVDAGGFACGATLAATCRYLEWKTDSRTSTTIYWCNALYTGGTSVPTVAGTSAAIGAGRKNTIAMRATGACTSGVANSLSTANFDLGWYIASSNELNAIRLARTTSPNTSDASSSIGWGTASAGEFYSSTQPSTKNGTSQWFDSGTAVEDKNGALPSIYVYAFNSTP